jgi:hypothetical protein
MVQGAAAGRSELRDVPVTPPRTLAVAYQELERQVAFRPTTFSGPMSRQR